MGFAGIPAEAQDSGDLAAKLRALEKANPQVYAEFVRRMNAAKVKPTIPANLAGQLAPSGNTTAGLSAATHRRAASSAGTSARSLSNHTILPPGITRAEFDAALRVGGLPHGMSKAALEAFIANVETTENAISNVTAMRATQSPETMAARGLTGSPLGMGHTATAGQLSAARRAARGSSPYAIRMQISPTDFQQAVLSGAGGSALTPHIGFAPPNPVNSLLGSQARVVMSALAHSPRGAGALASPGATTSANLPAATGLTDPNSTVAYGDTSTNPLERRNKHRFGHGYFSNVVEKNVTDQSDLSLSMNLPGATRYGARARSASAILAMQMMNGQVSGASALPLRASARGGSMSRLLLAASASPGLGDVYHSGFSAALVGQGSISGNWLLQPSMFGSPDVVTYNLKPSLMAERQMNEEYRATRIYGGQTGGLLSIMLGLNSMGGMSSLMGLKSGMSAALGGSGLLGVSANNVYAADHLRELVGLSSMMQMGATSQSSALDEVLSTGVK
jgi:hypothetical protein